VLDVLVCVFHLMSLDAILVLGSMTSEFYFGVYLHCTWYYVCI